MDEVRSDIYNKFECISLKLEANEELLMIVRKHWIIVLRTFGLLLFMVGICTGVFFIGNFARIPYIFTLLTVLGLGMVGLQHIFIHWVNDELDILILTNRRIITLNQIKFLDRQIFMTTIDSVQEVNGSTAGLIGNFFEYGDIIVRTASDTSNDASDFHLKSVPDPIGTSRKIHALIDEHRHSLDTPITPINLWQK